MELVSLLAEEPELGVGLSPERRRAAEHRLNVPSISLPRGPWRPANGAKVEDIAYLVTHGLLLRRVLVPGGRSLELLAKGDCLLPGREEPTSFSISEWTVSEPAGLAVLDMRRGSPLANWSALISMIAARSIERSRRMAMQAAIMSIVGVEERLHALLWGLAERWGKECAEGTELEIHVPQHALAEMVGARRPTVSQALGSLAARGVLEPRGPGRWLLKSGVPSPIGA
jgi:hypothetical protein